MAINESEIVMSKKMTSILTLIDSFNFKVKEILVAQNQVRHVELLSKDNDYSIYYLYCDQNNCVLNWSPAIFIGYCHLVDAMLNNIAVFRIAGNIIANPYFGCKSLEEALIKKDLFEEI